MRVFKRLALFLLGLACQSQGETRQTRPLPQPAATSIPSPVSSPSSQDCLKATVPPDGAISLTNCGFHLKVQNNLTALFELPDNQRSYITPGALIGLEHAEADMTKISFEVLKATSQRIADEFGVGLVLRIHAQPQTSRPGFELVVELRSYVDFPNTVLSQLHIKHKAGRADLRLKALVPLMLELDRQRLESDKPSYDFHMVSMSESKGNSISSRIHRLSSNSDFELYNGGDVTNDEFDDHWGGGGTPVTSVWGPQHGVTLGVVSAQTQILAVPVKTQKNAHVQLKVWQTNELPLLRSGQSFSSQVAAVSFHKGDFYRGVQVYGQLMARLGLKSQFSDADYEPYWCSFGLEERAGGSPGDPKAVEKRLYIPKELDLSYINIDSGWEEGAGQLKANRRYFKDNSAWRDWLIKLANMGFKVSLWWDPGFGAPHLKETKSNWYIKNPDGSYFEDEWGRSAMSPLHKDALDYIRQCTEQLIKPLDQGGWGVQRLFLDGTFMRPPDHSHSQPHQSEKNDYLIYKTVYEEAKRWNPDVTIENCPCGWQYNSMEHAFHHSFQRVRS